MKVIIAGGNTFDSLELMETILEGMVENISVIVSGRGYGADHLAESFALKNAIDLELFPANWGKYGRNAGYDRWLKVFQTQNIDRVVLFWNGKSPGTKKLIDLSKQFDIPCDVYYYEDVYSD